MYHSYFNQKRKQQATLCVLRTKSHLLSISLIVNCLTFINNLSKRTHIELLVKLSFHCWLIKLFIFNNKTTLSTSEHDRDIYLTKISQSLLLLLLL